MIFSESIEPRYSRPFFIRNVQFGFQLTKLIQQLTKPRTVSHYEYHIFCLSAIPTTPTATMTTPTTRRRCRRRWGRHQFVIDIGTAFCTTAISAVQKARKIHQSHSQTPKY